MYLMLKDSEVIYFNFEEFIVQVISPELVPYSMRHGFKSDNSMQSILYNVQLLKSWLSRRVLSLSRDNAKQLYTLFNLPQLDDVETRVNICLKCKGISITDSYWLKDDNSKEHFKDVNVRERRFKEIIDISLNGIEPTITTSYLNPELTTHGLFRKAWVREDDGLYLLKSDKHCDNINTKMEVLASKILSCFENKIDCVEYNGRYRNTKTGRFYVDKCKCFGNEVWSFVEAWELMEYCKRIDKDFKSILLGYSPEVASIGVLDFLLVNTDRHNQNYGFKMNNITGRLIGVAPLFDFNCALVADAFNRDATDTLSQMFNDSSTLRQIAYHYNPYSGLILDKSKFKQLRSKYKEYDYIFDKVMERCIELGIVRD